MVCVNFWWSQSSHLNLDFFSVKCQQQEIADVMHKENNSCLRSQMCKGSTRGGVERSRIWERYVLGRVYGFEELFLPKREEMGMLKTHLKIIPLRNLLNREASAFPNVATRLLKSNQSCNCLQLMPVEWQNHSGEGSGEVCTRFIFCEGGYFMATKTSWLVAQ